MGKECAGWKAYQGLMASIDAFLAEIDARLLYLAGVCASRSLAWRSSFDKLLAKGLPKTAVNCIVARKILRVTFAIWKSGIPFNPAMIGKA
jgi:hypothetical protein